MLTLLQSATFWHFHTLPIGYIIILGESTDSNETQMDKVKEVYLSY